MSCPFFLGVAVFFPTFGEVGSSLLQNKSNGISWWWCCFGGVSFRCYFVSWAVLFSSLLCVLFPHPSFGWCCLPPPCESKHS